MRLDDIVSAKIEDGREADERHRKANPMRVEVALARSVAMNDAEYETGSEEREREPVSRQL